MALVVAIGGTAMVASGGTGKRAKADRLKLIRVKANPLNSARASRWMA
jgi:hypothetical protein